MSSSLGHRVLRGAVAGLGLVTAEGIAVLTLRHRELTSVWEVQHGVMGLVPLAFPVAGFLGAAAGLAWALFEPGWARRAAAAVLATFALGSVAYGVGGGRHLATLGVRLGFATSLAAGVGMLIWWFWPWLVAAASRHPRRWAVGVAALLLLCELANRFVLVRLYPAFHLGLALVALTLAPGVLHAVKTTTFGRKPGRSAALLLLGLVALAALAPVGARHLSTFDNFRWLLAESAPLLGQSVALAARLAPPPPLEAVCDEDSHEANCGAPVVSTGGPAFSLGERDLLLVTIDALRADHLGLYGYGRPTSPSIDALASAGVTFERAYAPTPHTSYSVTSMMTGKYMRPLLLQGAAEDSDTWASLVRQYGVKTAGFYPPAVFFIDGERFTAFSKNYLGFEYRKVEFLEGDARIGQVERYLKSQPAHQRLFVWVHLFSPHEPYLKHEEHDFGERDIDRYDSEIRATDAAVGKLVQSFRARRPNSIVVLSADHGEEFGDHGGRYHGTSVFEEQIRVPLIVNAPGLFPTHRVAEPVQTIDLLPTMLSAMTIPRPPRLRGRDLGELLMGKRASGEGLALAETDEQVLLAEGSLRLICARQLGACKLYDIAHDPGELDDLSDSRRERFEAMRQRQRELSASHGRFEARGLRAEGRGWPAPIMRGISGDTDAAEEIAALLDDAEVTIRRKAAELLFELHRESTVAALLLALGRDEDRLVRSWAALALTRLGQGAPLVFDLAASDDPTFKRLASLALAEVGDPRGFQVLLNWWKSDEPRSLSRSRELLVALAKLRDRDAVPALLARLPDLRLRPYIAEALAELGDESARGPLLHAFAEERYQGTRLALGKALVQLKSKEELARPLVRFLGVPDPLPGGLGLAQKAGILEHIGGPKPRELGRLGDTARLGTTIQIVVPKLGNIQHLRAIIRVTAEGKGTGEIRIGIPSQASGNTSNKSLQVAESKHEFLGDNFITFVCPEKARSDEYVQTLPDSFRWRPGSTVEVRVFATTGLRLEALAILPLSDELPPPPPQAWTPRPEDQSD